MSSHFLNLYLIPEAGVEGKLMYDNIICNKTEKKRSGAYLMIIKG